MDQLDHLPMRPIGSIGPIGPIGCQRVSIGPIGPIYLLDQLDQLKPIGPIETNWNQLECHQVLLDQLVPLAGLNWTLNGIAFGPIETCSDQLRPIGTNWKSNWFQLDFRHGRLIKTLSTVFPRSYKWVFGKICAWCSFSRNCWRIFAID